MTLKEDITIVQNKIDGLDQQRVNLNNTLSNLQHPITQELYDGYKEIDGLFRREGKKAFSQVYYPRALATKTPEGSWSKSWLVETQAKTAVRKFNQHIDEICVMPRQYGWSVYQIKDVNMEFSHAEPHQAVYHVIIDTIKLGKERKPEVDNKWIFSPKHRSIRLGFEKPIMCKR